MKRTILIIDDDELCRTPAAAMLRAANWNVVEAENGEHGFELAVQHRPDVIVCDLLIPVSGSVTVLVRDTELPEKPSERVLLFVTTFP